MHFPHSFHKLTACMIYEKLNSFFGPRIRLKNTSVPAISKSASQGPESVPVS